jgi:threonine/homoserine/homoserine lactone efflux protein
VNSVLPSLVAFVTAASLLTITPGLDTALVLRTAVGGSPRTAAPLLAASKLAYVILRWIGAAYLLWVGYKMLRNPRRTFVAGQDNGRLQRSGFVTGALTNLLNPKVGIFYVSFLPQFVPPNISVGPYILLLGAIHALLGLIWFACLIAATQPIARFLRRSAVVQACDRLTGGMFIAFGLGLALQTRRT